METGPIAAALLEGRDPASGPRYHEKVRTLHGLVTGRLQPGHPLADVKPHLDSGPPLWLLGLSAETAELAGALGVGFCFSSHHGAGIDGPAVVRRYRDRFIPSPELAEPATIVVVRCLCAGTDAEAKRLADALIDPLPPDDMLGSPARCASRIAAAAGEFSTSEIMIIDLLHQHWEARLEMYRLLGQELGLA
jgi:alkanesulfonate monooxygenase SsuD/methylene tetrahydromethanopterin reductase-like flavin-dependent oxidoreductase (luciferase family)